MPLMPGKENVGKNIKELMDTGKYPHRQAVAIALSEARKTGAEIPQKKRSKSPTKPKFKISRDS